MLLWEEGQLLESWSFESCISALAIRDDWLAVALLSGHVELRRGLESVWSCPGPSPVRSLALGSSFLAMGLEDGRVRLLVLGNLQERPGFRLDGHVTGLAFLRDQTLAACSPLHQGIELWRLSDREACGHLGLGRRRCLAALPEGGFVAGGEQDVVAWPGGQVHRPMSPVLSLGVDDRWLTAGCVNADLRLWQRSSGRLGLGSGHRGEIFSVAVKAGQVASGSVDTTIRIWTEVDFRESERAGAEWAT